MHHSRAEDLNPAAVGAGAAPLSAAQEAVDAQLHSRLNEREVVTAKGDLAIRAEDAAGEVRQRTFQVGQTNPLIYGQPLHLNVHPLVGWVSRFVAVHLARDDNTDGRFRYLLHHAYLVGRGVGTEEHRSLAVLLVVDPQCVPHIAGRVIAGNTKRLEVVVVPFDLRAFHDLEAHGDEAVQHIPQGLCRRVKATSGKRRTGKGDVYPLGVKRLAGRLSEACPLLLDGSLQLLLQPVSPGAHAPALLYRQVGQAAQNQSQAPTSAQVGDSPAFQRVVVSDGIQLAKRLRFYLSKGVVIRRHRQGGIRGRGHYRTLSRESATRFGQPGRSFAPKWSGRRTSPGEPSPGRDDAAAR